MKEKSQAPEGGPSVMASWWTPVHLGLPQKFTEVMIAYAGSALPSTGQYTGNLRDSADGWSYPSENSGDDTDWTVTHWRPLPEHPEAYRFAGSPDAAALAAVQSPAEGDELTARSFFERWALHADPDKRTNWQIWSAAWTCAMSQPQPKGTAKPIGVEVVGVVRPGDEDGPNVEWLLEGGLHAVAEGGEAYLLVSHEPITNDDGYGEVVRVNHED